MPRGVFERSEEHKRNMSRAHIGMKASEEARRNMSRAQKGKIISEEHKRKLSKSEKGRHNSPNTEFKKGCKPSEETRRKISLALKGLKRSEKARLNMSKAQKGRIISKEHRLKLRLAGLKREDVGEKHWNWKGGISFEPYDIEFNKKLRGQIRKRDGYRCQQCFRHEDELNRKLSVHHIDFNKKHNTPNNLISLCNVCHGQTAFNRDDWINYFQTKMIKSGCVPI